MYFLYVLVALTVLVALAGILIEAYGAGAIFFLLIILLVIKLEEIFME